MKRILLTFALLAASSVAAAHSASDAYLTLSDDPASGGKPSRIHGQWDIALRDLDFVSNLDDDGDGEVTWGEFKRHQAAIERYAYDKLTFRSEPGNTCSITPTRALIDGHADGTYVALFFDVICRNAPKSLTMNYSLFFALDPSHRGIFVMHSGEDTSTAVLSPQNSTVVLPKMR